MEQYENDKKLTIWYIRHSPRQERTWYRHKALAEVWQEHDFEVLYPDDLHRLARQKAKTDIAIVAGSAASVDARTILNLEKQAALRVFIPSWQRGRKHFKLQRDEIRKTGYHLVIPDQRMFLDDFRKVHRRVFYVDRGFDPTVFYPAPEEEKSRWIVFCGNYDAYGRLPRLKHLAEAFPSQVEWEMGMSHQRMAAFLRSGRIGWNQIMRGPPTHKTCINYRVWEVVGSGILLLCSHSVDVPLLPGVQAVFWDSEKDMMEKAAHFLTHEEHRQAIARRGYEEALAKHTWHHRALEYKKIIEAHLQS